MSVHAGLLLKLKPHFLSMNLPYPAGIKYKTKKQIKPKKAITISMKQYTKYDIGTVSMLFPV